MTETADMPGLERLASAARIRVKDDEPPRQIESPVHRRGAFREGKVPGSRLGAIHAERPGDGQVSVDGVGSDIDRDSPGVEAVCTFPRIGKSDELPPPQDPSDQRTAEEPLEIENEIGTADVRHHGTKFAPEREDGGKCLEATNLLPWKLNNSIEIGVALEQRPPLGIDDPADAPSRLRAFDPMYCGEGVDDVPEGTRLDDEDVTDLAFQIAARSRTHFPWARRSASICGRPASTIFRWVVRRSYSRRRMVT